MLITIGTKYKDRATGREKTVVDIHTTYNHKGELVRTSYVTEHKFLNKTVTSYDVPASTIERGRI